MSLTWLAGAGILALASCVFGLAGFGLGLVATVSGCSWEVAAGVVSGLLGGTIGTPGPPVILYAAAQGWPPRAMKATLQGFLFANQLVILVSQWWAGLLTPEVAWLALGFAPASRAGRSPRHAPFQGGRPRPSPPRGVRLIVRAGPDLCLRG